MPPKRKPPTGSNIMAPPATSHEADVRWVMSKLSAAKAPKEHEAPSTSAWSMYEIASIDAKSKTAFLEKIYSKIISKEKPTETGQKFADDKRKFFLLFQALETERPDLLNDSYPRSQPREVGDESAVQSTDAPVSTTEVEVGCELGREPEGLPCEGAGAGE